MHVTQCTCARACTEWHVHIYVDVFCMHNYVYMHAHIYNNYLYWLHKIMYSTKAVQCVNQLRL